MAKKKEKRTYIYIKGVAVWPKLDTPDVYTNPKTGKSGKPKYKINVQVSDDELKRVRAEIVKFAETKFDSLKGIKLPLHVNEETKEVSVPLTRSAELGLPLIVDAQNNKLPEGLSVGGGSLVQVNGTLNDYEDGINVYLNAVQVLKFEENTFGKSPFEATEGFVVESRGSKSDDDDNNSSTEDDDEIPF